MPTSLVMPTSTAPSTLLKTDLIALLTSSLGNTLTESIYMDNTYYVSVVIWYVLHYVHQNASLAPLSTPMSSVDNTRVVVQKINQSLWPWTIICTLVSGWYTEFTQLCVYYSSEHTSSTIIWDGRCLITHFEICNLLFNTRCYGSHCLKWFNSQLCLEHDGLHLTFLEKV